MLGKPKEQIFLVFYGPSAGNGKSLLIDTIKAILGEYAALLPTVAIMTKSTVNDGATPSTARLAEKRLAVVFEPNKKHVIDSGMVKQMTGDRQMNVRGLYGESKDIDIEFVLLLATNDLPSIRDDDHGLWRRLRIVPFTRKFSEEEMDKSLGDKLRRESSGILNLMLTGLSDYLSNGMNEPPKVRAATGEKRNEIDPIAAFLADAMAPCDNNQVPLKALFDSHYKAWQKENAHFAPLTKPEFKKRLQAKGYHFITKSNLSYVIGLKPVSFEV
jgi:P4 family phage/plasmid primase-like protien